MAVAAVGEGGVEDARGRRPAGGVILGKFGVDDGGGFSGVVGKDAAIG